MAHRFTNLERFHEKDRPGMGRFIVSGVNGQRVQSELTRLDRNEKKLWAVPPHDPNFIANKPLRRSQLMTLSPL